MNMIDTNVTDSRPVLREFGYRLNPWQEHLLSDMLSHRTYTYLVHGRQTGGSYTAHARILLGLLRGERILYAAQLGSVSSETQNALAEKIRRHPEFVNYRANGKRRIVNTKTGGIVYFRCLHGKKGGRGMAADLVIADTPQLHEDVYRTMLPVLSAVPNGKLIWLRSVDLQREFPSPY